MTTSSDLGSIHLTPSCPVVAGSEGRWVFTYTAGPSGVDIVRNNRTVATFHPAALDLEVDWDDPDELDGLLAQSPNGVLWHYVRVRQTDGEMAWSSPIWIVPTATTAGT